MDRTERHSPRRPSGAAGVGRHFLVGEADAPQAQSAAVALRTLGGIDALIALQGIEDPVERRRRRSSMAAGRSTRSTSSSSGCWPARSTRPRCCGSNRWPPTSRRARATTGSIGPRRDRPAGRGRAGQSRHVLKAPRPPETSNVPIFRPSLPRSRVRGVEPALNCSPDGTAFARSRRP